MKKIKIAFRSEDQQVYLLVKIVAFFWLITKTWSWKAWIAERTYPVIPSFGFLENVPGFFHTLFLIVSLLALIVILLVKHDRRLFFVLFLSELLSCLLDTVRWQSWEFMYMCFLLILIINYRKPKNIILLLHLMLVAMYFFSGLHKLNRGFLSSVWIDMILIDFLGISFDTILKYKLFFAGLIIPFLEILLALLLLFSKYKRKISLILIFMHLLILLFLGPFGLWYNSVVWWWNIALIFILLMIYQKPNNFSIKKPFVFGHLYWLFLWFLMPIFSFFGKWYQYFSFNLYSGKIEQMYICISSNKKIDSNFGKIIYLKTSPCINLQNWAMSELKCVPIPEIEIYKKISNEIKRKYGKENVKIILYNSQNRKIIEL